MAPTEPNRLQVTPSCPLVAPLFLFPGVHLSFTAVISTLCFTAGTTAGSGAKYDGERRGYPWQG